MAERVIETSIDIDAPPDRVWAVLTNFSAMPGWNPFIKAISGDLVQGGRLLVHVAPPGKSGMRFKPVVVVLRPERELRWLGRLLLPGIFNGEHYFLLHPSGEGGTHFIHGERFSGVLVALLGGSLAATEEGFKAMNAALKARAETEGARPD